MADAREISGQLFQAQLAAANGTVYDNSGQPPRTARIDLLTICNTGAAARTFTLDIVPAGGSAGAARRIFAAQPIAAGETITSRGPRYVMAGGSVQGLASAASEITVTADGVRW